MFDIQMNTKPTMSLSEMAQGAVGGNTQPMNNNMGANGMNSAPVNNMQSTPVNNFNSAPVQNNFNNAPVNNMQSTPVQNTQPIQSRPRPQGNGVHLKKGQKFALAGQGGAALQTIQVCLGWDILNQACDLDASAFMLGADGRVIGDDWFVFYGQTVSPDGSITHSGDSTNGAGVGDDEIVTINLNQVNQQVQKITFVVTINEALENGLNFSMVSNAYVRVVDKVSGNELARFSLTDYYANVTSMVVGELYRYNGAWKFNAVGDGVAKDLAGLCGMYGVNVAD